MAEDDPVAAQDELWTPGVAAHYLNAGAVNLGFTSRLVSDMIRRGDLPGVQAGPGGWHRTPASTIRALREKMLSSIEQPAQPATFHPYLRPEQGRRCAAAGCGLGWTAKVHRPS